MEYDVTVIGGGIMGYGLALQFGAQSQDVTLLDHREENLDRSKRRIRESLEFLDDRDVLDASPEAVFDRIGFTLDGRDALERTDVVLETISENLEAKRDLFEFVADVAPPTAVLATNTSGLEIGDIAEAVPEAANRVAGCHWWNPPYLMPLVEVVRGPETSTETIERLERFVEAVDRDPIRVNVDVPGIVWNRIQFAVLRECMHLVESDVASLSDVNKAVRDGYARRTAAIGPFETVDLSGLDLFRNVAAELYPHLCSADSPSRLFDEYLEKGRTGVDAGTGFFEYDESLAERSSYRDEQLVELADAIDASRSGREPIR